MKRITISRELRIPSLTLCALALAAQGSCATSFKQQQPQKPPPSSSPTPPSSSHPASEPVPSVGELPVKRRKVWTNDDVVTLRTPADEYLVEKEEEDAAKAKEAANAKAAATKVGAKPGASKDAALQTKLPSSIEETRLLIKNKEQDISDDQTTLDGLNGELAAASEEQLKAKQKEIEIVADELGRAKIELRVLQDHLAELQKPAANVTAAPPPSTI